MIWNSCYIRTTSLFDNMEFLDLVSRHTCIEFTYSHLIHPRSKYSDVVAWGRTSSLGKSYRYSKIPFYLSYYWFRACIWRYVDNTSYNQRYEHIWPSWGISQSSSKTWYPVCSYCYECLCELCPWFQ